MRRTLRSGLVVFALLLSLFVIPAAAGAAPDLSNGQYAQACQKGGYANFTRTDGSTFANTGDCASYTAGGGILVPVVRLPDLVPGVACQPVPTARAVTCIFTIINVGAAAATGTLALNTTLTIPVADGVSVGIISLVFDCPGDVISIPVTVITTTVSVENYASCGGATLLPGEQATVVLTYDAVSTASVGTPLTFAATVDPANAIAESNEGNNTFNAVITHNPVIRTP